MEFYKLEWQTENDSQLQLAKVQTLLERATVNES